MSEESEPVFTPQELVNIREALERYVAYKHGYCFCPLCREDDS